MQEIQRHYFHQKDGNIIRDEKDDKENIAGNSNDCTVGNSEITGVHGNSNELQMTTGVPQINIEGDSPEEKGNADYTEGNIDNIGNSPKNNAIQTMMKAIKIKMRAMALAIHTTMGTVHP